MIDCEMDLILTRNKEQKEIAAHELELIESRAKVVKINESLPEIDA